MYDPLKQQRTTTVLISWFLLSLGLLKDDTRYSPRVVQLFYHVVYGWFCIWRYHYVYWVIPEINLSLRIPCRKSTKSQIFPPLLERSVMWVFSLKEFCFRNFALNFVYQNYGKIQILFSKITQKFKFYSAKLHAKKMNCN